MGIGENYPHWRVGQTDIILFEEVGKGAETGCAQKPSA